MATTPLARTKNRTPKRENRGSISVSIPWGLYDRLDPLAQAENTSISSIVEGLLDAHESKTETRSEENGKGKRKQKSK